MIISNFRTLVWVQEESQQYSVDLGESAPDGATIIGSTFKVVLDDRSYFIRNYIDEFIINVSFKGSLVEVYKDSAFYEPTYSEVNLFPELANHIERLIESCKIHDIT